MAVTFRPNSTLGPRMPEPCEGRDAGDSFLIYAQRSLTPIVGVRQCLKIGRSSLPALLADEGIPSPISLPLRYLCSRPTRRARWFTRLDLVHAPNARAYCASAREDQHS